MTTEKSTVKTEAVFSEDKQYRYLLKKEWDNKKAKVSVIMTNPSAADMIVLDYTTMFITNNLAQLDYGGFDVLNMIPLVTTKLNLETFEKISDEVFEENIKHIQKSAEHSEKILIAWGSVSSKSVTAIKNEVLEALKKHEEKIYTISNEYGGKAYHPLAPQIRNIWFFNKYSLSEKRADPEEKNTSHETKEEKVTTDEQ